MHCARLGEERIWGRDAFAHVRGRRRVQAGGAWGYAWTSERGALMGRHGWCCCSAAAWGMGTPACTGRQSGKQASNTVFSSPERSTDGLPVGSAVAVGDVDAIAQGTPVVDVEEGGGCLRDVGGSRGGGRFL